MGVALGELVCTAVLLIVGLGLITGITSSPGATFPSDGVFPVKVLVNASRAALGTVLVKERCFCVVPGLV